MLIRVYVTPNAKEVQVVKVSEDYFEAKVDERALGGRANKRLFGDSGRTLQRPKIKNHYPKRNQKEKLFD